MVHVSEVEKLMKKLAHGEGFSRMGSIIEEQLGTGGKRLRTKLALDSGTIFGLCMNDNIAWASAVELLHNATLIHDDIQDGDKIRRGKPTTWSIHGISQAINAGDLMLMLPFSALEEMKISGDLKWKIGLALAKTAQMMVRGQSFESDLIGFCGKPEAFTKYLSCVASKTGSLFKLVVEGAALISGMSPVEASQIAGPFEELGILFQMQDDVLDLYGNKGRGLPGHDIREGKVSCLVIEHIRLKPQDRTWLLSILEKPRELTTETDVRIAMEKFVESGALSLVLNRINDLSEEIKSGTSNNSNIRKLASELAVSMLQPIENIINTNGSFMEMT